MNIRIQIQDAAQRALRATVVRSPAGRITRYQGACTCGEPHCAHPVVLDNGDLADTRLTVADIRALLE